MDDFKREDNISRETENSAVAPDSELNNAFNGVQGRLTISMRVRRMADPFIPPGSRRRQILRPFYLLASRFLIQPMKRVYSLLRRSREVILLEGWNIFWFKIFNKLFFKGQFYQRVEIESKTENFDNIYESAYLEYMNHGKIKDESYVALSSKDFPLEQALVKLIAFYLPQFHPIPQNDEWWGRGFTEWSNVSKAVPQFLGHYQPHLPGELGFYDLRLPEVEERQVELACKYGIYGFAFYYYWFNGKRLLEKPLENYLHNSKIDFPFCICWANENWTRRWDGLDDDVLIAQEHTAESDLAFIHDLVPLLRDPRYLCIGGRPLIIVYRAKLLPHPAETAKRWREYCIKEGLGDPYLVAVQAFGFNDPREVGFDAAIEFPPLNQSTLADIKTSLRLLNPEYRGKIYSYYDAIRVFGYRKSPDFKLFRGVFPSWDNEARRPGSGYSFTFSAPHAYKGWLTHICQETIRTESDPEKRLVFVNAWNEWAEGAHLEPDRKYGYAYLQATADALQTLSTEDPCIKAEQQLFGRTIQQAHQTAVFLHLFYPDMWDELRQYLDNLSGDFDFFISIPDSVQIDTQQFFTYHKDTYIYRCKNHGRDVAPFLSMYNVVAQHQYPQALKLHTKKSKHREDGDKWRLDLYTKLMGTPQLVQRIQERFEKDSLQTLGIIAPEGHIVSSHYYLASNKERIEELARLANLHYFGDNFEFVAGSMFWFRMESLLPLSLLNLQDDDFEPEAGQVDGTLAHALERMFGMLMYKADYKICVSDGQNVLPYETNSPPMVYNFAPLPSNG